MGLFKRPARVDTAAIAERMRPAVAAWFPGRIQILKPSAESRTGYDPRTGVRTTADGSVDVMTLIYDSGDRGALVQPVRSATPVTVATGATSLQAIRFQAVRKPEALDIRDGMLVRVLDGGENGYLEQLVFSLKGQPDSAFQWHLIMEATLVTGNRWA